MIDQIYSIPEGLLELQATELYKKINDHTLLHLEGKIKQPLVISVLQHGDEHTGWDAIKAYLQIHADSLNRSLVILFGNISAARFNKRQLPEQPDFNRCWPGTDAHKSSAVIEKQQRLTQIIKNLKPFASVDIHNNSGRNPHYSGINSLQPEFINLASLFCKTMIYFTSPKGVQSGAFAKFCPSVTVECGMSGNSDGRLQTYSFLEKLTELTDLTQAPEQDDEPDVFKVFSTVKVKDEVSLSFCDDDNDVNFLENLDAMNFLNQNQGTVFGKVKSGIEMPLEVFDANGVNITETLFELVDDKIISKQAFVPAMITRKIQAIRSDCLCYLMRNIKEANT